MELKKKLVSSKKYLHKISTNYAYFQKKLAMKNNSTSDFLITNSIEPLISHLAETETRKKISKVNFP